MESVDLNFCYYCVHLIMKYSMTIEDEEEVKFFEVATSISFFFIIFISFCNLLEFFVAIILLYPRCFAICEVDCNHSIFELDVCKSKAFHLFVIVPFCAEILLLAFSVFFCSG